MLQQFFDLIDSNINTFALVLFFVLVFLAGAIIRLRRIENYNKGSTFDKNWQKTREVLGTKGVNARPNKKILRA